MLTYALYFYLSGFALFLLGFSIFMYFENRKFGDNQFTVKLLPPPPRISAPVLEVSALAAAAFSQAALQEEKMAAAFSEAA